MDADLLDHQVRLRAFDFLDEQSGIHGEVLPWGVLNRGFEFDGKRVPLVGPQGIFKPGVLPEVPLSIVTAPVAEDRPRPYEDGFDQAGFLIYRYRGTDRQHRDNVGLRLAMQRKLPLIYLFGVTKGQYMAEYPVYIVGDDPSDLSFRVAFDDRSAARRDEPLPDRMAEARRSYVTVLTLRRVHQQTFRQRVLRAYQERCSICRLKHVELLDAAHILPDGHPRGEPVVPNGLALCKLHHAAFDGHMIGIRPDLVVEVRRDIMEEDDGPMLLHGLQEAANVSILVPRVEVLRPNPGFLEERYAMFKKAG